MASAAPGRAAPSPEVKFIAVPTGGTFKACQRIFKDDPRGVRTVVKAVDEYNTTKVDWETGETKELVYRVVRLAAGQRPDDPYALSTAPSLGHVAGKTPPFAPTQDRAVLAKFKLQLKARGKVRRGGAGCRASCQRGRRRERIRWRTGSPRFEVCAFARGAAASGAQNCACTSTGTRSPRSRLHDFGRWSCSAGRGRRHSRGASDSRDES